MEQQKQFCKKCGAEMAFNPASGKLFCSKKCWLNNQPQQNKEVGKHDIVVTRTEKPHSYEFGKASARHKIYYNTVEELRQHIKELTFHGLVDNEITTEKI